MSVKRISDERLEFLTYVLEIGLIPQAQLRIQARTPFGDVMTLKVEGRDETVAIGRDVANSIFVLRED